VICQFVFNKLTVHSDDQFSEFESAQVFNGCWLQHVW